MGGDWRFRVSVRIFMGDSMLPRYLTLRHQEIAAFGSGVICVSQFRQPPYKTLSQVRQSFVGSLRGLGSSVLRIKHHFEIEMLPAWFHLAGGPNRIHGLSLHGNGLCWKSCFVLLCCTFWQILFRLSDHFAYLVFEQRLAPSAKRLFGFGRAFASLEPAQLDAQDWLYEEFRLTQRRDS
jgi:hypothetical protein